MGEVRTAKRLGNGSTCRVSDGYIDFITSLPFDSSVTRVYAAAAGAATVGGEGRRICGKIIDGVRAGRSFALMVRTEERGDVLAFLPTSSGKRKESAKDYLRLAMRYALRLKKGDSVTLRVRRTDEGISLDLDDDMILVGTGEDAKRPSRPDRREFRALDAAARAQLEALHRELDEEGMGDVATKIAAMGGAAQRVALCMLADHVDVGHSRALSETLKLAQQLPADRMPPDVGASALRALFADGSRRQRAIAAQVLGLVGCREGIQALEEAKDLYGDRDLANAAEKAIEQIRRAPPR
jgi:DNA-binding FrmR family transcriptional regulator